MPANPEQIYDVFVIGGGINGCGIARDAVGRGYSVYLAEMNDLASGTSSWSTKLVHGGLRYLEHYEFRLVREALTEREVLWQNAPHIIRPLRFVLPYHKGLRPAWMLRLGLFLYDHIGGRKLLPTTSVLNMQTDAVGKPLKPLFSKAFEYSDCWVDDARLVVLNARDAADRGAVIRTRTMVTDVRRENDHWRVATKDLISGLETTVSAKLVVNAAGPWVDKVLTGAFGDNNARNVRLVKGSHIVVNKMFDHDRCYIFQNTDGRIIFAIPYERDYTLVGTTDQDFDGDPAEVKISSDEITYLCEAASEYFSEPIREENIVWTYSGVRPLYDDGATKAQEATREYVLELTNGHHGSAGDAPGNAAILNIYGGKITTYRKLAEAALEKIESAIGAKGPTWTETAILPGGDFSATAFDSAVDTIVAAFPDLDRALIERLFHLYGTLTHDVLKGIKHPADLGRDFGAGLFEAEINYLMQKEWAVTADDVLWRRSKLGLKASQVDQEQLEDFMSGAKFSDGVASGV